MNSSIITLSIKRNTKDVRHKQTNRGISRLFVIVDYIRNSQITVVKVERYTNDSKRKTCKLSMWLRRHKECWLWTWCEIFIESVLECICSTAVNHANWQIIPYVNNPVEVKALHLIQIKTFTHEFVTITMNEIRWSYVGCSIEIIEGFDNYECLFQIIPQPSLF